MIEKDICPAPEKDLPQRKSIRLKGYDYSQGGMYFVTICVEGRQCILADARMGSVAPSEVGAMVAGWWQEIEKRFEHIRLDAFVVMPNHLHGVIIIDKPLMLRPDGDGRTHRSAPTIEIGPAPTLGDMLRWFKTMTTNEFIRGVRQAKWSGFKKALWQRGYYEHIIRGENGLNAVRQYINENPANWERDEENPARRA